MRSNEFRHNCRINNKIVGKKNEFSSFLNFKHLFLLPSFRSPQNVIKKIIKEQERI
jgi:hypothetical protein